MKTYQTTGSEDTRHVAGEIAQTLKSGDVLALFGDLGSGKTTFVQGLADTLGIPVKTQSPTFLLVRTHTFPEARNGIETLYHLDLYRLDPPIDVASFGLQDFMGRPSTLTVIEWAEKMEEALPEDAIRIRFEYLGDMERRITVENSK
jgi:tRNA threonylcarbamoyladenosine biosynthesis protein TsaE